MNKLIDMLQNIKPDVDFENENHLVDDGVLDSFDIIAIVSEINDSYEVDIEVDDIVPENFNSAQAMLELIERLKG